jgi:hypothetical protein
MGRRLVDKLVRVWRRQGDERLVPVHVKIHFPIVKLLNYTVEDELLQANRNPFAVLVCVPQG